MSRSVADRVVHRMPRPVRCDDCGSPRIALQSRALMGMSVNRGWGLIWYCSDCQAFVGTHEGTDIPLGLMADRSTRDARYRAHKVLDPIWRGRDAVVTRDVLYEWIATLLELPREIAHISMLNERQCEQLIEAAPKAFPRRNLRLVKGEHKKHWQHASKKKRRK